MKDEVSSAVVALTVINAAIWVWKGNFKVSEVYLAWSPVGPSSHPCCVSVCTQGR